MEDFGKTEVADFEDIGSVEAACKTEVNPRKRNTFTLIRKSFTLTFVLHFLVLLQM